MRIKQRARRAAAPTAASRRRRTTVIGLGGTLLAVVAVVGALTGVVFAPFQDARGYAANFTEAGGLVPGDKVFVSGVPVGEVTSVTIEGTHVRVGFDLTQPVEGLGDSTGAAVISQTALGKKALEITPRGTGRLEPGATIPVERTLPAFDVTQALNDLTQTVEPVRKDRLADSLDEMSQVLDEAAPAVRPALSGLSRFSRTIGSRDAELQRLLAGSAAVTRSLARRDDQVRALFSDGAVLFAALNQQSAALDRLFEHATEVARQVDGLIADNRDQTGPALRQVNDLLALLQRNRANIDHALDSAAPLVRELGEVVAAFPGFNVYIPNLAMTNLIPGLPGVFLGGGNQ